MQTHGERSEKEMLTMGAELDEVPSETKPRLHGDERLSRAKGKRKKVQLAFGLFESK